MGMTPRLLLFFKLYEEVPWGCRATSLLIPVSIRVSLLLITLFTDWAFCGYGQILALIRGTNVPTELHIFSAQPLERAGGVCQKLTIYHSQHHHKL